MSGSGNERAEYVAFCVKPGDTIYYPAALRKEHGGVRSGPLTVVDVRLTGHIDCTDERGRWTIYPQQVEDNGVLVAAAVPEERG